ncbi:unnamed protein product, partial [Scytosiphon promiscuus]
QNPCFRTGPEPGVAPLLRNNYIPTLTIFSCERGLGRDVAPERARRDVARGISWCPPLLLLPENCLDQERRWCTRTQGTVSECCLFISSGHTEYDHLFCSTWQEWCRGHLDWSIRRCACSIS